jgi:hypothetical protein
MKKIIMLLLVVACNGQNETETVDHYGLDTVSVHWCDTTFLMIRDKSTWPNSMISLDGKEVLSIPENALIIVK